MGGPKHYTHTHTLTHTHTRDHSLEVGECPARLRIRVPALEDDRPELGWTAAGAEAGSGQET